jgi:hypothetical protein
VSRQIEQQDFGAVRRCGDRQFRLALHCGAVPGAERLAIHVSGPARDLKPAFASGAQRVLDLVALVEKGGIDVGVLVDDERAVTAAARRQQAKPAALFAVRESLLLVAWR